MSKNVNKKSIKEDALLNKQIRQEFVADLDKVGIDKSCYDLQTPGVSPGIRVYNNDFYDKFKKIGIVTGGIIDAEDLKKISKSIRWILADMHLITYPSSSGYGGGIIYKIIDGHSRVNNKQLIGQTTSETIKNLIQSEIKKALKQRGIKLDEHFNQIVTTTADIILSSNENKTIDLGIKKKNESGQVSYINLTQDDIKKLIDTLTNYI